MTAPPPMFFRYNAQHSVMVPRSRTAADKFFVDGEIYRMEVNEQRSDITHKHQFAWLKEAWKNLPQELGDLYPTPEHLRKRALIEAGYYDEEIIDCSTQAAALRVAAFMRAKSDMRQEFAHVIVRGRLVLYRTPKSQSRRAMNRKEFRESKQAILEIVSNMIGVKPEELNKNAGRAA